MRLTLLGTDSQAGQCPTLYATDRDTYVIQGWTVTDPEALADLKDVLEGETFVEVPKALLRFAKDDQAEVDR
ncbi:hypothetical protein [Frankia sp. ACN1ag]|uniref:hypothetical protein n=1 Tax=Frankia sp. ACN1ag TaxID=102891 RepID=UPI0006DD2C79|nr:hypothetical protein [Frankia sp. ACN1ag]KQC37076.1 hypothetical protein UK82_17400 [Frankia sp. ACN1ag]